MGSIDYFGVLFFLFVCMNYVPNQNGKVLEETLAGFDSDALITILRRQRYFKMTLLFL